MSQLQQVNLLPKKCPCGRPAATEKEHAAAHAAGKCAFCYDFGKWAELQAPKVAQS